jgi:hypothetical protein
MPATRYPRAIATGAFAAAARHTVKNTVKLRRLADSGEAVLWKFGGPYAPALRRSFRA